jgi:hypothetical protein
LTALRNINLSKSDAGFSTGIRGLRTGVDAKGRRYSSVGLPGTGLSWRSYHGSSGGIGTVAIVFVGVFFVLLLVHARLPTALAELQTGWAMFLEFALDVGGIGKAEHEELEQRGKRALGQLAALQVKYQEASDPASRFVALLQAALACGRAHVADRRGRAPEEAAVWGWQPKHTGRGSVPPGTRIGWVVGSDLFVEPAASYQVAQEVAGAERIRWASRLCATGCGSVAFCPASTQAARCCRCAESWRAA